MNIVIADSVKEGKAYADKFLVGKIKIFTTKTEGWRGMCWYGGDVVYVISKKSDVFGSFLLCFKGCAVFNLYLNDD